MPSEHALARDVERAAADPDRVGDAVDAVDHDHGVGGLGRDRRAGRAHRDPDVGERERGRVVDPVADHHDRPEVRARLHRADDLELLLGRLLAVDPVDADRRPIASATAALSPVTSATWRMPAACRPRCRLGASSRSRSAIATEPTSLPSTWTSIFAPSSSGRAGVEPQEGLPTATRRPSTRPAIPLPTVSSTLLGEGERRAAAAAASRTSAAASGWVESWSSEAARRSASSGAIPSSATTSSTSGVPSVSVPVLSRRTVFASPEPLDHAAALDDHAGARGPRDAGDERDRGGEDQRARRRDDEHARRAHGIAARGPGGAGHEQRDREEDRRVAVGDAARRAPSASRPGGRGGRGPRTRSRRPGRAARSSKGSAAFEVPLRAIPPRVDRRRQRLAGERRLVDDGLVRRRRRRRPGRPRRRARRRRRRRRGRRRGPPRGCRRAAGARRAARARRAPSARAAPGPPATSSSALPPASISAITAPARYSPGASAPAIATSAIASTPTSRCHERPQDRPRRAARA